MAYCMWSSLKMHLQRAGFRDVVLGYRRLQIDVERRDPRPQKSVRAIER